MVTSGEDFSKRKRKLSHLMGIKPAQNDPTFVKRDGEDLMIMSWLWNLMLPEGVLNDPSQRKLKDVMLESQLLEGSTMGSTKTSEEGIKRDVKRQGSTIKTVKNESTRLSNRLGVILSIYGTHPNGWDAYNIVRWSHLCLWKTIAHMLHVFSTHTRFVVGDGPEFVFGKICGGGSTFLLTISKTVQSHHNKNLPISDILGNNTSLSWDFTFRRNLSGAEFVDLERLLSLISNVHLSPSVPDAKAWVSSSSRAFSTKVPSKVRTFDWGSSETIDHLFLHCPITFSLTGYRFAHFRVGSTRRRVSIPSLMQVQESNLQSGIETPPPINDLDVPIALKKGIRNCTQHPLSHFVSLDKLSPQYKSFFTQVDPIQIPQTHHEALMDKNWKNATNEEMKALIKINLGNSGPSKRKKDCGV
ncbi:hypothetical protein CK203_095457 [Vitis vinifera]|uniref:Uncharacterized protein n=1 Tax=Vitis vinifera TaxID=29760 RepID=A0A438EIX6_VITVI|nr:hypothetical protein CK203_095457 [Vitis vinifera]